MKGTYLKATIIQGSVVALIVEIILFAINYPLVVSMLNIKKTEDYSFQDSYFVVYRGILENTPKLAALFWIVVVFAAIVITYAVLKWLWFKLI
ncbi:hypothetical protein EJP77_10615 [Paenibacillus zeisoli]|uniref:Uncharacterized protein n=1 Tax=Paenibacillus zeisoli TaxID=2496267 RepID=A0A433XD95_9BACL|nr:hypothetical protein [Paenibacillus zeisoli]RUT31828.1 hypothetical protein EJP77_10615 [Paenibacillus zeisoli]